MFDLLTPNDLYQASCTTLVIWGTNLSSMVGGKRLTKVVRNIITFPYYIKSVIVGLLLSDANLQLNSSTANARLMFEQSFAHFDYFWHVFIILSPYCLSYPRFRARLWHNSINFSLTLITIALPCLTDLRNLFYVNGIKCIPADIFNLLTPVALAHWIQGDGEARDYGLILCTDSYTLQDVVILMNVLIIRYNLECTLRVKGDKKYRIYIRSSSMPRLRSIVSQHMVPSMLYKLGS
jgi:hypothetical protein